MSDSPAENASSLLNLKFEDAPPFGGGSMPVEQEKTFVMLAHFFAIIVWPWKRKTSPAVDAHGKEALNFAITILIFMLPLQIVARFLPDIFALIITLVVAVIGLAALALVIIAMINAKEGKLLRYPVNFRLIK